MRIPILFAAVSLVASAQAPDPAPVVLRDPDIKLRIARVDAARIEKNIATLAAFGTRHSLSDATSTTRGIGAARNWLGDTMKNMLGAGAGTVELERHIAPKSARVPTPTEFVNVVTTIPGSDPNRVIVISGHYDSMPKDVMDPVADAPGANDDASGTAVVLECIAAMSGATPRATIILAALVGEEQGLIGADFLAERLKQEGKEVTLMVTNDIVGGVRGSNGRLEPNVLRCFSEGVPSGPRDATGRVLREVVGSDNDSVSRQVARYLAERAPVYVDGFEVRLVFRQDRFLRGGDHKPFNDRGFAAVRLTEPNENYDWQHQDVGEVQGKRFGDRPENLDKDYIKRVAQVNIACALEAAFAPPPPKDVRIDVMALTPHTTLRWRATLDKDVAAHAVLSRRTHEPTWTGRRVVPKETNEVTLEGFSKDDWLFAIEAVGPKGHRSPPIYPTPAMRPRTR